jgi:acyl transferase domain-containing protein
MTGQMEEVKVTPPSTERDVQPDRLHEWLHAELARLLDVPAIDISDDTRFADLGLDSLRAQGLVASLREALGTQLSPTVLWTYPTLPELVAHLRNDHTSDTSLMPPQRRSNARGTEPIAVVGMACRFPGASTLDDFWKLLVGGVDAVGAVPADRWVPDPALGGGRVPTQGGFLNVDVDAFDPLFFGISPREAAHIDPQQRLLLEVAWEALEQAAIAPDTLRGSRTGVFVGAIWRDYGSMHGIDPTRLSSHSATGQAMNMVANRLSYVLGLCGPSMTVDSACSSSLLALHLACQSIKAGECDTAVVGGVNLLLSQATMVSLTQFGGLSPDGRCKAFDADGDGFGRGEGCGVVVLKPLSAALADGDQIWSVIRGSAVNNDGPSNGLTAPSPRAQEDVLRQAYQRADVAPSDVHFVETHGTGTALGDPIEAAALGTVLGADRTSEHPLVIGSLKTNIGHLEGAAGIAGLIKASLCLTHRAIPPNLHFHRPNPYIDFVGLGLRVPTSYEPWPDRGRLAGVSSFGWGGTNVHVVLGGWDESPSLPALLPGARDRTVPRPKVAFVCSPHGHQWVGMGRQMLRTEATFRAAIEECDRALTPFTGWSVLAKLFADEADTHYDDVSVTQPILFAIQVALAKWLGAQGVRPDIVVGHSLGEIAATVIAGIFDITEAARIVSHYSRQQRQVAGRGEGMAIIDLSAAELTPLIEPLPGVVVATRNGPRSTAIAGPLIALEPLLDELKSAGVLCAMIKVNVAAHSPAIDEIRAQLIADIGTLTPAPSAIPMVSTVTGEVVDGMKLGAEYFARNLREPVILADVTANLLAQGYEVLVELSATAVLLPALKQSIQNAGSDATAMATMMWGEDDRRHLLKSLHKLDRLGVVETPQTVCRAELFTLSAMSETALHEYADRVADMLEEGAAGPMPTIVAAANRRADLPHRLATVACASDALVSDLRGRTGKVHVARKSSRQPKIAFVFPGQGSQWVGMGVDLYAEESVFATAMRRCDRAASDFVDWSIVDELHADPTLSRIDRIDVIQPMLFAIQVSLAELWRSWGVQPDAVIGHSMGEAAAAHIAGALSLEDAIKVICLRSRLMRRASGQGAMLAVELAREDADREIERWQDLVSVAVTNSPMSTVLAGDRGALGAIADHLAGHEVFCRWVKVDIASHSPQMEPLRDDLLAALTGMSGSNPTIPMYSTVSGKLCDKDDFDPDYWYRNLRSPVLFGGQVAELIHAGLTVFVELSPHPVLLPAIRQVNADLDTPDITVLPSMHRDEPARDVLLDSLGALYTIGAPTDRKRAATPALPADLLPNYPWQRERYRIESTPSALPHSGSLLGERLDSAVEPGTHYWSPRLNQHTAALVDHLVDGRVIVPGSVYLEMALRAAQDVLPGADTGGLQATGLQLKRSLRVEKTGASAQLVLVRDELTRSGRVRIFDDRGRCVAGADVSRLATPVTNDRLDIADVERRLDLDGLVGERYYERLADCNLAYGPAYRLVESVWHTETEAYARIGPPRGGGDTGTLVHPALLDAALHASLAPALTAGTRQKLILAGIEHVNTYRILNSEGCYAYASVRKHEHGYQADVTIHDSTGQLVVAATGITIVVSSGAMAGESTPTSRPVNQYSQSKIAGRDPDQVRESLLAIPSAGRLAKIETYAAECVAIVARMSPAAIDPDQQLRALGIDSLMTLEVRDHLDRTFGLTLSSASVLSRPTVRQLASLIAERAGIQLVGG